MCNCQPEFAYIKQRYNVPAEYGRIVEINGKKGFIVKDMGNYIGVTLDEWKSNRIAPFHPTDKVTYLGLGRPRKMTASQRRYLDYLEVADCFDGFKNYLLHLSHKKQHPYLY